MNTTDDLNSTSTSTNTNPRTSIRRHGKLIALSTAAAATLVVGSGFGIATAFGAFSTTTSPSSTSASRAASVQNQPFSGHAQSDSGYAPNYSGGYGQSSSGSSTGGSDSTPTVAATATQQVGVVDVTSQLTYDNAEGMGTGLVITSNGEILTNNHVVAGATSISVTVVSTGTSYTASVIGTDATDDIAVLQLSGVSGLLTAAVDSSAAASVGSAVTGVGNAGGVGGTPSSVTGTVTALDQTITTQAEGSAASETLTGLIESSANIQAGDSGGPLYNASNRIIGIDTAAATGGSAVAGYSIPIKTALAIADQIESGRASSQITLGNPAFLGVEVIAATDASASGEGSGFGGGVPMSTVPGATIGGVIEGTGAANAGLSVGDTITAVNGTTITSASDLTAVLAGFAPGQDVTLTWVDASGASATATVTLGVGPAA
ncbi:S1C family serine protease [Glaciibacter psychrotolerans]|uniref:S1-C subfamily serine protease n=1 Tax=Glaciibacter psychrotolerans TaxID=670054 RepID=A0A7Z0EBG2_9MICO|nr:trypsin-like peptidase domain-containing protein [Leifsonia psychrotolerans]NYJ18588.1 S1-C subfamily serine protease [Leifsonia psychrotolerans]